MKRKKNYSDFCRFCSEKSFALIGLGISNMPLIRFLLDAGAKNVSVRDLKKKESDPEVKKASADGAKIHLGDTYLENLSEDVIVRSPGIRPDLAPFLKAQENGARITCETELFLEFCPCTCIGVTGSDGKTTTTTLIAKMLENAGVPVLLGGNIGKAMLCQLAEIQDENTIAVLELSSFQLMNCHFSPEVAVITNLAENHLDWHRGMAEYVDAKKNLIRYQTADDVAVFGWDNAYTRACSANGKKRFFSLERGVFEEDGVYFQNGSIYLRENGNTDEILSVSDILLPGKHNILNYMAAIAAVFPWVKKENIFNIAKTFGGVEHRIELVRELNGVKFYNSSIDSSPSRSVACLESFPQKVILIAGGYDKHLDYTAFGDTVCRHVKTLILCGQTSEKIKTAAMQSSAYQKENLAVILCSDLKDAVQKAKEAALPGDIVVLSPASASFDQFRNFEERGKTFKKYVSEL